MIRTIPAGSDDARWNSAMLFIDSVSWSAAFAFVSYESVMPLLVSQFTASATVVGAVQATHLAGWLLPQMLMAGWIKDRPLKKPYLVAGLSGRVLFWGVALALMSDLIQRPQLMLGLLFGLVAFHSITNALTTVALFDIFARALDTSSRTRLFAVTQVVGGFLGIGVGGLVGHILASTRHPYPSNYAMLFAIGGLAILPSTVALAALREPAPSASPRLATQKNWIGVVLADPNLRKLMVCQLLAMMFTLASTFYPIHASQVIGLPTHIVGVFIMTLHLSGMVSSILLGFVGGRSGAHQVIRLGSAVAMTGPLIALIVHQLASQGRTGPWMVAAYASVYVALGVANSIRLLGFRNYLMSIAQADIRPAYVGVANTALGALTLAPLAGGRLLEATSYTLLFAVASVLTCVGFLVSLSLKPVCST